MTFSRKSHFGDGYEKELSHEEASEEAEEVVKRYEEVVKRREEVVKRFEEAEEVVMHEVKQGGLPLTTGR